MPRALVCEQLANQSTGIYDNYPGRALFSQDSNFVSDLQYVHTDEHCEGLADTGLPTSTSSGQGIQPWSLSINTQSEDLEYASCNLEGEIPTRTSAPVIQHPRVSHYTVSSLIFPSAVHTSHPAIGDNTSLCHAGQRKAERGIERCLRDLTLPTCHGEEIPAVQTQPGGRVYVFVKDTPRLHELKE